MAIDHAEYEKMVYFNRRKKFLWVIFCHFGGHRPMSPKIFVKIGTFKLKKLPGILFLYEESEKIGPETIR
jgi:hypothetical protein